MKLASVQFRLLNDWVFSGLLLVVVVRLAMTNLGAGGLFFVVIYVNIAGLGFWLSPPVFACFWVFVRALFSEI